ncbi:MAG: ATP-binding cassette domain-containing protein [Chloroflexi bacterium]|nr:ATP-binding cassette domain-containing protein [Chloroflexota bacterium]
MAILVRAKDVTKKYGGQIAVDGISFAVRRGEIFGLLGPTGAGKSTTIAMLATLLAPTSGIIAFEGMDLTQNAAHLRHVIGIVPQELALYPTLSARDNLVFFGELYGLRGRALETRIDETLELLGLTERATERVETYSDGMKRRVNLAAGLLHRPKILFLDEPTAGVDPQSRNAIFENVEHLNRQGMTILYTTHYMEEAERLCHRVGIMDRGKIIALDTSQNLIRLLGGSIIHVGMIRQTTAWHEPDGLLNDLRVLPEITSAQWHTDRMIIQTHNAAAALAGIANAFQSAHEPMRSLEILEPNLESVFLHLTGKSLRD